jgi:hypothetical protein
VPAKASKAIATRSFVFMADEENGLKEGRNTSGPLLL